MPSTRSRFRRTALGAALASPLLALIAPALPASAAASAPAVPAGQAVTGGLLAGVAATFDSAATGWTSFGPAVVGQTLTQGHAAPGALAVTSAGPWTGAASPTFPVVAGLRYTASASALAASAAHTVGLGMQFFDANGAMISSGSVLAGAQVDSTSSWSNEAPVVGFAPAGAVRATVLFLTFDAPAGDVQYLDDLTVSEVAGTASPVIGPLSTSGTQVLDATGRAVTFHGIDLNGLQYADTNAVTQNEVATARAWGANFIRLPLAENYAVPGDCSYDPTYLLRVDALVASATASGMFIMLDLHTNALAPCAAPRQQVMPDAAAVTFWHLVAARYAANPLVGFDLYNEPHDITPGLWHSGGWVSSSGVTYPAVGMQQLYQAVRDTGATNLVFASGLNWATAFPTGAALTGTFNLIYAAHAYTCPSLMPSAGGKCTVGPDGTIYDPSGLLGNFAAVGTVAPVMVTEFGFPNKNDGRYLTNVAAYATAHNWVGWSVYAFDNGVSGSFDLWKDTAPIAGPSAAGMAVMTAMLGD